MAGSGLQELLETIYANNAVTHMLTGKAVQRACTAKLWLQFMKMMDILRMFLKGERMGIWALHIQAMYEMMPCLAASRHNLYTTCIHVYLQQMHKLHETHPEVSIHFDQGLHAVGRSDRFWTRLSPNLVSEQVLVRSMKTSGGLTRGRGMTKTQRLVWLMANPVCPEVNNAMQQLTGVPYHTSEQHKDLTTARQGKYMTDSCEHRLSMTTMKQYRSIHNCCFKGSSQQELGLTSWKISSNSNFAAIFEAIYVMMPANKPALADAIWALMPKDVVGPTGQSQYVLDGGPLVHRIP